MVDHGKFSNGVFSEPVIFENPQRNYREKNINPLENLYKAINGAINKRLSDDNLQQFEELFLTPANVNVKVNLDPVYAKALDKSKASDTRRQVFVFLILIQRWL